MRAFRVVAALMAALLATPLMAQDTPEVQWGALFIGGKKVGHLRGSRTVADGKVTTTEALVMDLKRSGTPLTIKTFEETVETAQGKPLSFRADTQSLGVVSATRGTIGADGKMQLTLTSGAGSRKETRDFPAGALMPEAARLLGIEKGLREGTTYSFRLFSPSELQAVETTVTVGPRGDVDLLGRVMALVELKIQMGTPAGKIDATSWVDAAGHEHKSRLALGGLQVEMIACGKDYALSDNDPAEFVDAFLIPAPKPLPEVGKAASVVYTLKPKGSAKPVFPATGSQQAQAGADGQIVLTVRPAALPANVPLPYAGTAAEALAATQPTRYLQSDDPKVRQLAIEAVGKAADAASAARKIEAFVADYIHKKDLSVGYATAAEVALSRQGDCTEHAVLTAAMCRAAGIPAQVVSGMAYVPEFAGHKAVFGPHAWTRVYLGGAWHDLDAALGFDAGHIAFTAGDGDMNDFFGVIGTLGQFTIENIEVRR